MKVFVVGCGGWGMALSILLHENGHTVTSWTCFEEECKLLREQRGNEKLLPGVVIPDGIEITTDMAGAKDAELVVLAVPSFAVASTAEKLAGIVKPDHGRIVLDGRVLFDSDRHIDLPPQERRVGYLFQHYALFPHMTVEKNILAGTREGTRTERRDAVPPPAAPLAPKCCAPCGWKSWQNATPPSFPADSSSAPRWHAFWWASPAS